MNPFQVAFGSLYPVYETKVHPGPSVGYDVTAVLSEVETILCIDP